MKKKIVMALTMLALATNALCADNSSDVGVEVGAYASTVANADFEDRDAGYAATEAEVSLAYKIVEFSYGMRSFDWDDAAKLPFGNGADDPWDELHTLALSASDAGFFSERWGWFWRAGVESAYEDEMDDSFGATAGGGGMYVINEDWNVSFGLMGFAHPVGAKVLPTVAADWRRGAERGFSASIGLPRTHVGYRFDAQWAARLALGMDGNTWRLANDSTVDSKGYVNESALRAGLYMLWTPVVNLDVEIGPELVFGRSVQLYNGDGESRSSYAPENAFGASARAAWRF